MALSFKSAPNSSNKIRVVLIDDSAVVRGLTRRWLGDDTRIEIVAMAVDGQQGIEVAREQQPDVILLDIEMPKMDGITALPQIRKAAPGAKIIMASTLTRRGAEVTIKALSLGATDYLPKPEANRLGGAEEYRTELISKIVGLGRFGLPFTSASTPMPAVTPKPRPRRTVRTRALKPSILVVASSTGGPQALQSFLPAVADEIDAPILVVQHMPATFTTILAEHLNAAMQVQCAEAVHREPIVSKRVYVAPGGQHMRIVKAASGAFEIALDEKPPVNFCRPAADPLFESAATHYGDRALGVVLTGMGTDGQNGSEQIVNAGGRIFAQDKDSCVVWGMPRAVTEAGLADEVASLPKLGDAVRNAFQGIS